MLCVSHLFISLPWFKDHQASSSFPPIWRHIKFFSISLARAVSACLSINHSRCRRTIVRRAISTSDIAGHHQIEQPGLTEPGRNKRSDERIWRVCMARAASKPGRNIGLYPFVLGSSPSKPCIPMLRPANCIASSVTATIVTSFKVAFAFLRCDLRTTPITSCQRLHDNLITAKTTARLSAAPR